MRKPIVVLDSYLAPLFILEVPQRAIAAFLKHRVPLRFQLPAEPFGCVPMVPPCPENTEASPGSFMVYTLVLKPWSLRGANGVSEQLVFTLEDIRIGPLLAKGFRPLQFFKGKSTADDYKCMDLADLFLQVFNNLVAQYE